jgi:hypothetical protein
MGHRLRRLSFCLGYFGAVAAGFVLAIWIIDEFLVRLVYIEGLDVQAVGHERADTLFRSGSRIVELTEIGGSFSVTGAWPIGYTLLLCPCLFALAVHALHRRLTRSPWLALPWQGQARRDGDRP